VRRIARSSSLSAAFASAALLLSSGWTVSQSPASQPWVPGADRPALGAHAGGGPIDLPDGTWYDATTGAVRGDVLETDAALIARMKGIGVDEAVARLRAQQRMDAIPGRR
jgi:hypothetical protein